MHELPPEQLTEINDLLDGRLAHLRETLAARKAEEARDNDVIAEDPIPEPPVSETDSHDELEDQLKRAREAEDNARAERLRILARAEEKAEQLRREAERLDEQRQAELEAEEQRKHLEVEAELARREAEAAAVEEERQRIEEEQRIIAEEERIIAEAAAEADRSAAADEAEAKLTPDTLEYPIVEQDPDEGNGSEELAEVVETPTHRRRSWPKVLAVASCVSVAIAGGAAATGNDGGAIKRAKGIIDNYTSASSSGTAKVSEIKIPRVAINVNAPEAAAPKPRPEKKPAKTAKAANTESKNTAPGQQVSSSQPSAVRRTARQPEPKENNTDPKPKTTKPRGLTEEEADPSNYTADNEPAGGASYGNIPTNEGGAAPYVSNSASGR